MADNYMYLEFPSKPENVAFARTAVAAFVSQLDPTVPELADISTAVSEAVTNIVVHAYPQAEGLIMVTARLSGQQVNVEVKDNGCGISDLESKRRLGTTTCSQERMGIGLSLIEACMDQVDIQSKEGEGTCLFMTKRLGQQGAAWTMTEHFLRLDLPERSKGSQTIELLARIRAGDGEAREQVINENLRLVVNIASFCWPRP